MVEEINKYVSIWEKRCYINGIPDQCDDVLESMNLVPSYRRVAIAILKNDHALKSLGFTPKESVYYGELKKIELQDRGVISKQLKLF